MEPKPLNKLLQGRQSISLKSKVGPKFDGEEDVFGNLLKISDKLKAQLKSLGYDIRFISKKDLDEAGGYHKRGWKVLKRSDFKDEEGRDIIDLEQYLWGTSPEGIIQRNEMVLAIRPLTMSKKHREIIDERTQRQNAQYSKQVAEQLRQDAKRANVDMQVVEGYDD